MKKNIIFFGGAGFLGNYFCQKLVSLGNKVTVIDLKFPKIRIKKVKYVKGDMCNQKFISKFIKKGSYIFIGFDLKKDPRKLNKAYNDSSNLTKKFNLNLLTRINNDMQANFNLKKFIHYGTYNPLLGAMESFLISKEKQQINIKKIKKVYSFEANETIHLEYSFKYNIEDIENLAKKSNYTVEKYYKNHDKGFTNSLWKK